jgi:hypothetical protein
MPLDVTVTGITHLVEAQSGSIMQGREDGEVSEGQVVQIETEDKLRSRRGPNQELYGQFDPSEAHLFRWFKALRVDRKSVGPNLYLRDETFETPDRSLLGRRPAKLDGRGRDRVEPEDEAIHALATQIVDQAAHVPDVEEVTAVLSDWYENKKPTHDPMKTFRFMRVAYAYSVNPRVKLMLQSGDIEGVKAVTELLRSVTGRQFIQFWEDPAEDVRVRGSAWTNFVEGVKALRDEPSLGTYLEEALEHDKGYAQTLESAGLYLLYVVPEEEVVAMPDLGIGAVLAGALKKKVNTNIWIGGMKGSGLIMDQLERKEEALGTTKIGLAMQEENMWIEVTTALAASRNPPAMEWGYVANLNDDEVQTVFDAVRKIVPDSFALSKTALETVIAKLG